MARRFEWLDDSIYVADNALMMKPNLSSFHMFVSGGGAYQSADTFASGLYGISSYHKCIVTFFH